MNNKKWTIITITITAILLLIMVCVMIVIDPLFQYHEPLKTISYTIDSEDYQNPGIAKNFDYNSVIVGSSMTENFKPSLFNEQMELKTVKLPFSGARTKNIKKILDISIANKKIKKVFYGLDIFSLEAKSEEIRHELPEYLYDNNLVNDVEYVLNKDLMYRAYENLKNTVKKKENTSLDEAYNWANQYTYLENEVVTNYNQNKNNYNSNPTNLDRVEGNLKNNIIPLIEQNPDTEFYMFFPPYSILYWDWIIKNDKLDGTIQELEYIIEELLNYDNVKVFYFQNIEEIITNLYFYRDYNHYGQVISDYMLECFANEKYVLNKENYKQELEKMRNLAMNFDYNILLGNDILCKQEYNLPIYLNLINDENYILIINARIEKDLHIDNIVLEELKKLGLSYQFNDNNTMICYSAVVNGNNVIYEKSSKDSFTDIIQVDGKNVEIISKNKIGQYLSINIDNIEYSKKKKRI